MSDQSVAIVTGGASGIGLGIASTLIAEDYDVFVLDNDLQHVDEYNAIKWNNISSFFYKK